MTLDEFKAWFGGFTENLDGPPNEKQWKRIKTRVGEIDGTSTPYPIFIDRYYRPYWTPQHVYCSSNNEAQTNMASGAGRFALAGRQEVLSCN